MELLGPWIPHLAAVGGLLIGVFVTWLLCRTKMEAIHNFYNEQGKIARKSMADLEAACASMEAENQQLRTSEAQTRKRQVELEVMSQHDSPAKSTKLDPFKKREDGADDGVRLNQSFRVLSNEAIKASQEEFVEKARSSMDSQETASNERDQRNVAVESLVKPVTATLSKVENRIVELEQARQASEKSLNEQVRQLVSAQLGLQKENSLLARAIREPGSGSWGEVQLRRVIEMSGMQAHCEFKSPEDGSDLVIKLPNGSRIAVDCRTPLESFLDAREAGDKESRQKLLRRHATKVANQLEHLSMHSTRSQLGNPEFIVLFLPGEAFLASALSEEPGMLERGIEKGVLLATPTSLVALLRAASVGWHQDGIAEKARTVSEASRELYACVDTLTSQVKELGKQLGTSKRESKKKTAALEGFVLPSARKLSELGAVPTPKPLPEEAKGSEPARKPRRELGMMPS